MVLTRQQLSKIFLSDAERAKKIKAEVIEREDQRTRALEANKPDLAGAGVGALTGFATGGPLGALSGGFSGAYSKDPLQAAMKGVSAGTGAANVTGGEMDFEKQLGIIQSPDNIDKVAPYISSVASGKPEEAVQKLGTIKQKEKETESKREYETKKSERTQKSKERIEKIKASAKKQEKGEKENKAKVQRENYSSAIKGIDYFNDKLSGDPTRLNESLDKIKDAADDLFAAGELTQAQYNKIISEVSKSKY